MNVGESTVVVDEDGRISIPLLGWLPFELSDESWSDRL